MKFNPQSMAGFGSNSNYSPVNTPSITDFLIGGNTGSDVSTPLDVNGGGGNGGFFSQNFMNGDGSLDFGNIGSGIQTLGNIFGAYMAMKQFGMNKEAHEMNMKLNKDNHNNNVALAQQQLDDQAFRRSMDNQAAYAAGAAQGLGGQPVTPQLMNSFGGRSQKGQLVGGG